MVAWAWCCVEHSDHAPGTWVEGPSRQRRCSNGLPGLAQGGRQAAVYYAHPPVLARESMASAHIVVHYHELWLKRGNRRFFLHKLREALRRALEGIAISRISEPADRLIIEFADAAQIEEALRRLARVSGTSHLGAARVLRRTDLDARPLDALCASACEEVCGEPFSSFAVRAKRSDKSFPL